MSVIATCKTLPKIPPPPRGIEAAFSSFAAPTSGSRFVRKSSHVRVVARIRPLSAGELKRGCTETVFPILPDCIEEECDYPDENSECGGRYVASSPIASPRNSMSTGGSVSSAIARFNKPTRSSKSTILAPSSKATSSVSIPSPLTASEAITPTRRNITVDVSADTSVSIKLSSPMRQTQNLLEPPSPTLSVCNSFSSLRDLNGSSGSKAQSLSVGLSSKKQFDYDAVFESSATQKEVYDRSVGDAVRRNIFRGYNTTIMTYGQSQSGKSHTMYGAPFRLRNRSCAVDDVVSSKVGPGESTTSSPPENKKPFHLSEESGIIQRAVHDLFKGKKRHASAGEITVTLKFIEICNDEIRDLLSSSEGNKPKKSARIRDHGENGGIVIESATSVDVESPAAFNNFLEKAYERRTTGSNGSSGSHAVCVLRVTINPAIEAKPGKFNTFATSEIITAKLTLIDLAGSDRLKQIRPRGHRKQESISINKDLFVLGKVITALADQTSKKSSMRGRKIHVPYRDSKLTRLLKDSLGGNCCTVLVACISPADTNLEESISTLQHAKEARTIRNSIVQNVVRAALTTPESAAIRRENIVLKSQVDELTRRIQAIEKVKRLQMKSLRSSGADDSDSKSALDCTKAPEVLALKDEISSLREIMADIDAEGSTTSAADEWKERFQKLADAEEMILASHRKEIFDLKEQLQHAVVVDVDDGASDTSGITHDEDFLSHQDLSGFRTDELDDNSLLSKTGTLTSSRLTDNYSLLISQKASLEIEVCEKKALRDRLEEEAFVLQEKIHKLSVFKEQESNGENAARVVTECRINSNISEQNKRKVVLEREIRELEQQCDSLRTKTKAVEVGLNDHHVELTKLESEIKEQKATFVEYERNAIDAKKLLDELETRKDRIKNETTKLKREVQLLTTEKSELMDEVEEYQDISAVVVQLAEEQEKRLEVEKSIGTLKDEVKRIEAERDSFRVKAATEADAAMALRGEIKALSEEKCDIESKLEEERQKSALHASAVDKRGVVECDSVRSASRPNLSASSGELGDNGGEESFDSSHQTDCSMQGDEISVKSEQQAIRIHAQKMLFWANKAIERQKNIRDSDSVASSIGSYHMPRQSSVPSVVGPSSLASYHMPRQNSVPSVIGPSSSRKSQRGVAPAARNASLPPRKGEVRTRLLTEEGSTSTDRTDTKRTITMASLAASTFDDSETRAEVAPSKSLPPSTPSHEKEIIDMRDTSRIITNLDQMKDDISCSCSTSKFSGTDEHSEFFLPKLGLACNCSCSMSIKRNANLHKEKCSFGSNPTALNNILRPWQCNFLESVGINNADQLLRAHKTSARDLARLMRRWRAERRMKPVKTKSCFVALLIWARTSKAVLRSVKKQKALGCQVVERPSFLDVSIASDTGSVSTLGCGSTVGAMDMNDMMEI